MTPIHDFAVAAAPWQNFYLLLGTAAATLIGLMFVALTFGAGLMTAQAASSARAFIDPPFGHFVTVLLGACLMLVPTMTPALLGGALVIVTVLRALALVRVVRHMRAAHARYNDIELSDWLMGVVLPAILYAALIAIGAGFIAARTAAFGGLAVAVVGTLLLGVFGAWELMIWLALTRVRANDAPRPPQA
ncbi:MAG TPA: hypothetical protein VGL86_10465 [Polyangia bacterium]|jgi:hypothetical protein